MKPAYEDLRTCLFQSQEDLKLFRSLIVKCVMATDIWDKEQGASRDSQWSDILSLVNDGPKGDVSEEQLATEKAILVAEHLIQVSDVSHTLQDFNVFTKWNKLLFKEMFLGYKAGRANNDPSKNWYESELKFFDTHVIPIANRLCECQVFRTSADICLANAINNRRKWEQKGRSIVDANLEIYEVKSAVARIITRRVRRIPSLDADIE